MPSEFERIDRFTAKFQTSGPSVIAGPGDDCAVTALAAGNVLVSKVDQIVEGVHFGPAFLPEEIGHKALAVALSDLAAAGATPSWFLAALAMPKGFPSESLDRLAEGMAQLAREAGIVLIGGNFTQASELSISITALGETPRAQVLGRGGAAPGDWLLLSGTVGDAALGLERLASGRPDPVDEATRAQLRPTPRTGLARLLAQHAAAAIDLSDGLVQDLGHLCARSGVGATIDLQALPLSPAVTALGERGLQLALGGGEDYELLCAARPREAEALLQAAAQQGEALRRVGTVVEGEGIVAIGEGGAPVPLPRVKGWEHFS